MASPQQQRPLRTTLSDEDYNEPSPERLEVLQRFQNAIGGVPVCFWAICHVCDLGELAKLASIANMKPSIVRMLARDSLAIMVAKWNQSSQGSRLGTATPPSVSSGPDSFPFKASPKGTSTETLAMRVQQSPSNTPPAKRRKLCAAIRSKSTQDNAAKRDGKRCILTQNTGIEVTHIYPIFLLKEEKDAWGERHAFWDMLRNFWPEEKVATWQAEVFPNGLDEGIETATNMITLSSTAHTLWNKGAFALKPISMSEDKTTLTIQFFWQAQYEPNKSPVDLLTIPPSTRDLDYSIPSRDHLNYLEATHPTRVHLIKSGDHFVMKTDDVVARPLPSVALLEMQWFLQRVMGMAGAADSANLEEADNSDDVVSDLALSEGAGVSYLPEGGPGLQLSDPLLPDPSSTYPLPSPSIERTNCQTVEMDGGELAM